MSTVPVSRAIGTSTATAVVATAVVTSTFVQTVLPLPTPTVYLYGPSNVKIEDVTIPTSVEVAVPLAARQTTIPAKWSVDSDSKRVTLVKYPETSKRYAMYFDADAINNTGFSQIQVTTESFAPLIGYQPLDCKLDADHIFTCAYQSIMFDFWQCGDIVSILVPSSQSQFQFSCTSPVKQISFVGYVA
jgi:hypothetical protein